MYTIFSVSGEGNNDAISRFPKIEANQKVLVWYNVIETEVGLSNVERNVNYNKIDISKVKIISRVQLDKINFRFPGLSLVEFSYWGINNYFVKLNPKLNIHIHILDANNFYIHFHLLSPNCVCRGVIVTTTTIPLCSFSLKFILIFFNKTPRGK